MLLYKNRIVITGGAGRFGQVLKKIKGIAFVSFDENDVVRHKLVKDIIKAYGDNNGK